MPFVALGVEHKTASLTIREQVSLTDDAIAHIISQLLDTHVVDEAAILSTCNRVEIYLVAADVDAALDVARAYLPVGEHLRVWPDLEAVEHLFRVASGLESQVLGEVQILAQVRDAFERAHDLNALGPNLNALFRAAIRCARNARAETSLGRINSSVGATAVDAAIETLGPLDTHAVLLIGGGTTVRAVAGALADQKPRQLFFSNRTLEVAETLASQYGGTAVRLEDIRRVVPAVDLIFSATAAPHYVLTADDITARAQGRPLRVYDLAVPRDADPELEDIPGVVLHDLDDLLPSGLDAELQADIPGMEAIIAAEVKEFTAWVLTRRVVPVISSLRSHVEAVQRQELRRVEPQLRDLTDRERAAVDSLTSRLIDKMFHHLVLRLRLAAQTDPALVEAAEFFFLHGDGGLFEHAAQMEQQREALPDEEKQR